MCVSIYIYIHTYTEYIVLTKIVHIYIILYNIYIYICTAYTYINNYVHTYIHTYITYSIQADGRTDYTILGLKAGNTRRPKLSTLKRYTLKS